MCAVGIEGIVEAASEPVVVVENIGGSETGAEKAPAAVTAVELGLEIAVVPAVPAVASEQIAIGKG